MDKTARRKTVAFTFLILTSILMLNLFGAERDYFVSDKSGKLVAINRPESKSGRELKIEYRISSKQGTYVEEGRSNVYLKSGRDGSNKKTDEEGESESGGIDLKGEMNKIISRIENAEGKTIRLPDSIGTKYKIEWKKPAVTYRLELILLIPPAAFYFFREKKSKEKEKRRQLENDVYRKLPGFVDQILLMMNSGLIFRDAFRKVIESYTSAEHENKYGIFESKMRGAFESYERGKETIASVLTDLSRELKVKEFSKIVNIIADYEYVGINIRAKLELERDLLWEQRKKHAEEQGRLAETKLTFPLAVLLLLLIVITAGPAMMQM